MWIVTADGNAMLNLERVDALRLEEAADGRGWMLWAVGDRFGAIVARGSEREMQALLRQIAREIDADVVGVLDVRTGKGALA